MEMMLDGLGWLLADGLGLVIEVLVLVEVVEVMVEVVVVLLVVVVVVLEVEVVVVQVVVVVVMGGYNWCWVELRILTVDVVQQLNGGQQFGSMIDIDDAQVIEVGGFQFAEELQILIAANR